MRCLRGFCLCLLVLGLAGCTVPPKPVYRTYPVSGTGIWKNGVELAEGRNEALRVAMVAHAQHARQLTYYMEVENLSADVMTIDPALFTLRHGPSFDGPDSLFSIAIGAVDPERNRLDADLSRSAHLARLEGERSEGVLMGLIDLTLGIAESGKTLTEEEKQSRELEEMNDRQRAEALEKRYNAALQGAGPLYPQDGRLRKTTILPGESVGGLVSFPVNNPRRALLFEIPAEPEGVVIPYRLMKHYPARRGH